MNILGKVSIYAKVSMLDESLALRNWSLQEWGLFGLQLNRLVTELVTSSYCGNLQVLRKDGHIPHPVMIHSND